MKEINYIVYGHTSYLDILEIQSDYIRNYGNETLFLNSNDCPFRPTLASPPKL